MDAAIEGWDLHVERNINYRSFEPILSLIRCYETPECQHWAVWALANLTKVCLTICISYRCYSHSGCALLTGLSTEILPIGWGRTRSHTPARAHRSSEAMWQNQKLGPHGIGELWSNQMHRNATGRIANGVLMRNPLHSTNDKMYHTEKQSIILVMMKTRECFNFVNDSTRSRDGIIRKWREKMRERERERMNVRIWMRKHNGMEMNEIKRNNLFSLQD